MRIPNFRKKNKKVKLGENEYYCKHCNGTGYEKFRVRCPYCEGTGKLDWIENIIGRKSQQISDSSSVIHTYIPI